VVALPGLKALTPLWRAKAEALADRLVAQRHFDAVGDLAEAYPLSIFPDTIGMTEEGRENLLVYARAIFNAFGPHATCCSRRRIAPLVTLLPGPAMPVCGRT
jgi:hypothetical protein